MAIAHVTFTCYYNYEVEIDDALYDEDPWAAEEQAIKDAYEGYRVFKQRPIADTTYDEVEVDLNKTTERRKRMTIKELVAILNTYPQDTEIMVYNQQGEYYDPPEIEDWFYNEKYNYLVLS